MAETTKTKATLRPWQSYVCDAIAGHEELIEQDELQGLSDFNLNVKTSIRIKLPSQSGHTWLTSYLAHKYPSVVVVKDIEHYSRVNNSFTKHPETVFLTFAEIYYAIFAPSKFSPSQEHAQLKEKISARKLILVDEAGQMPIDVLDFIFSTAKGKVVLLG